jgi:hypothetical protein
MKRVFSLALCLVVAASFAGSLWAKDASTTPVARDYSGYNIGDRSQGDLVLHGGGAVASKAPGDTVMLYGGPGSLSGKFQTAILQPDRQGWLGVDLTVSFPNWHISDFNASNLGGMPAYWVGAYVVPATNHAMWDGVEAGLLNAPGYGNSWFDQLDRNFTVPNPAAPTTLNWDFSFNIDSEPGYDFLIAQWDSAGNMIDLSSFSGDNRDTSGAFTTPAVFSETLDLTSGMYAGVANDQVHLRILFDSDTAWSDEDGGWPTDGACQIDNIQVNGTGANSVGLHQATFEGGALGGWFGVPADYAGEFSKVFIRVEDIDICRDNDTPQMTFIDDGTPPQNVPGLPSTGGSVSGTWNYGVPGGWVVNYTGGLTLGSQGVTDEVWSPEIDWNLPGTADDAIEGGAFIRFGVWQHLPLTNGIFWVWHVRANNGTGWSNWGDRNFVYYGGGVAVYVNVQASVRDLLVQTPDNGGPQQVQLALGVSDLADAFGFPGNDATPSPTFDTASFGKYLTVGPSITGRDLDWFQDSFPQTGEISCTDADDIDLAIRVDMAQNIRPRAGTFVVAGDSAVADFVPLKPGTTVDANSVHMEFILETNPCFDAERAAGIAAVQAGAGSGASNMTSVGPNKWRGFVRGVPVVNAGGNLIPDRYSFDLPDGPHTMTGYQTSEPAIFFPGDELRYYYTATSLPNNEVSTSPLNISGFDSGVDYNRTYRVVGLPSLTCGATDASACTQPNIIWWNDLGDRGGENEFLQALGQNGLTEFQDYDTYTTRGPSSLVDNGLGSITHGANADQFAGYNCLLYEAGDLASGLICDGSGAGNNDKSADVQLLTAWMGQEGDRFAAYFGDNIAAGLAGGALTYRSNVMGVSLVDTDTRSSIGSQASPRVAPTAAGVTAGFAQNYVAYGGCLAINIFDEIDPGAVGALKTHEFLTPTGGAGAYVPSASVYYHTVQNINGQDYDRTNITFPYGFLFVYDVSGAPANPNGVSARTRLLRELLTAAGHTGVLDGEVVAADDITSRKLVVSGNVPNPFNPVTKIQFTAPARGELSVKIYNLRGELVSTLLNGVVEAGPQFVQWNGTDAQGASVSSGVYVYKVEGFGQSVTKKMALVK